jgi:hypothetical protein
MTATLQHFIQCLCRCFLGCACRVVAFGAALSSKLTLLPLLLLVLWRLSTRRLADLQRTPAEPAAC